MVVDTIPELVCQSVELHDLATRTKAKQTTPRLPLTDDPEQHMLHLADYASSASPHQAPLSLTLPRRCSTPLPVRSRAGLCQRLPPDPVCQEHPLPTTEWLYALSTGRLPFPARANRAIARRFFAGLPLLISPKLFST